MRLKQWLFLVTLSIFNASIGAAQRVEQHAGIDGARAQFLRALATKDTAVFRVALTDDAITWFKQGSGGAINTGLPAVMRFYASLFSSVTASLEMVFSPDGVSFGKETAFETGMWRMPAFNTSGAYVTVYHQSNDGHWRIAFWKAGPTLE